MNAAAWAASSVTTDIDDQAPWSDDMTNQGNPVLCEEAGLHHVAHQPKRQQLHITEDFTSDEKSQIQALDRTAPVLPMQPHACEKRTHDYVRHGTTTLFAALEIATGTVSYTHLRAHETRHDLVC